MNPTFSIITPSHSIDWIIKAWQSVKAQTEKSWEWIVLYNNGETNPQLGIAADDPRVKFFSEKLDPKVGALKKRACELATGDYIVELDHDDELSVDCLAELRIAFERPERPVFVFSDCASVTPQGAAHTYGSAYGWKYHSDHLNRYDGTTEKLLVPDHPAVLPQNVAKIFHAPNHVRAWRRDAYLLVGGHDSNLEVCDDLDLMCKLYILGTFHYIPKLLYRYLVHGDNTWLKNQGLINQLNDEIYDRNIEQMALVSCQRSQLSALDLGGGINSPAGWTSVDMHSASVSADLSQPWPFEENSVGALRAHDFIEHVADPIHLMNEAYRVLVHGGLFLIEVPSTDGRGAFQDPSHISFWNSNSFWYYTKAQTQHYIKHLGIKCRFQAVRTLNYFPSEWHKAHNILYTKAHLAAIKEGPRLHGIIEV